MIDGTGAVDQLSARLNIFPDYRQNVPLEFCQFFQVFLCHLVLDIRLPADDAEPLAREIRDYDICLLIPGRIFLQCVPHLSPDIGKSGPADVILHQKDLLLR